MATKRTPVNREMPSTRSRRRPSRRLSACKEPALEATYAAAESDLIDELNLLPWDGFLLDDPTAENPYPAGSVAAAHWDERAEQPETGTLFRALQEAASAARAARKAPAEAGPAPEQPPRRQARSRRSSVWTPGG